MPVDPQRNVQIDALPVPAWEISNASSSELANSMAGGVAFGPLCSVCQKHLEPMLTLEPPLKLIGAQYLSDKKIIGPVLTEEGCAPGHDLHFRNDGMVRANQQ